MNTSRGKLSDVYRVLLLELVPTLGTPGGLVSYVRLMTPGTCRRSIGSGVHCTTWNKRLLVVVLYLCCADQESFWTLTVPKRERRGGIR